MTKRTICFCMTLIFAACSRYPADVEKALKLAGDNRAELEKVLEHYSQKPEDKMKLQSAYFLIGNMPYHFTVHDARMESFKSCLAENEPEEGMFENYTKSFGLNTGNIEIQPDINHITSEFLIRNIDFSFQLWQETPWGQNFSFDDFCEEILPYRLSNEPIEYWKEEYYAAFRPVIDTMAQSNRLDEVFFTMLRHIQEIGWNWDSNFGCHGLGASTLLQKRYGNCKEQAEYITYVLRSVGIPSGINMVIQNPDDYLIRNHLWNYTRNISGKHIGFGYYDSYQNITEGISFRKNGKIYQQNYALQKESLPVQFKDKFIPSGGLGNVLLRDVSFEYFPDTHISIHPESHNKFGKSDIVYLCVFNGKGWTPVAWSKTSNEIAKFQNVEPNILYQLRFIERTWDIAASKPFIFHDNEKAQFLEADTTNYQSMKLLRKFRLPLSWPDYVLRAVGGKFQGANRTDFSDSVTLHIIQEAADMSYVDIQLENREKYKYVRYLSSEGGYNNMAEVQFYSNGKLLSGMVIGTDGAKDQFPNSSKYALFDNDPLSFFDSVDADGSWAGLEFDMAYQIEAIRYIFRNDDNSIRPGDTYELLYHKNGQWFSSGRKTADTTILHYENVPSNTLYRLHNLTRGKEERPFTYENGKQVWW